MLLANVYVAGTTCAIQIGAAELHPFEIAFSCNLLCLLFLLSFLIPAGLGAVRAHAPRQLAVPGGGHLVAVPCDLLGAEPVITPPARPGA